MWEYLHKMATRTGPDSPWVGLVLELDHATSARDSNIHIALNIVAMHSLGYYVYCVCASNKIIND